MPQTSPLLKLPPELRDRIYEFAVLSPHVVILTRWTVDVSWDMYGSAPIDRSLVAQPALTKTCRQIRAEALAVFYSSTTFLVLDHVARRTVAEAWLVAIGRENRARPRQVYTDYEVDAEEWCYHDIAGEDVRFESVMPRDDVRELLGRWRGRHVGGKVLRMTFSQD